jgi:hypothetical protein
MLKLDTRADLEELHTGLIQESLTLEYKSSGGVEKTEGKNLRQSTAAGNGGRNPRDPEIRC